MTKRRAHAEFIEQWMNDSSCVVERQRATDWIVDHYPSWHEDHVYRIKEAPVREYPKTSYCPEELRRMYAKCPEPTGQSLFIIANEVIKRHIQDTEEKL